LFDLKRKFEECKNIIEQFGDLDSKENIGCIPFFLRFMKAQIPLLMHSSSEPIALHELLQWCKENNSGITEKLNDARKCFIMNAIATYHFNVCYKFYFSLSFFFSSVVILVLQLLNLNVFLNYIPMILLYYLIWEDVI
jgi:hypothetical protein